MVGHVRHPSLYHDAANAALTRGLQLAGPKAHASKGHRGPMAWLATACGGADRDMDPEEPSSHITIPLL